MTFLVLPRTLIRTLPSGRTTSRLMANIVDEGGMRQTRDGIVVARRKAVEWKEEPPAHHANNSQTRFRNPWPSFRFSNHNHWLRFFFTFPFNAPVAPHDLAQRIPSQIPDWGAGRSPEGVKATWLGHACFLVELPTPAGAARGPRVLFDPVLSTRCSPVSWAGPARLLPTPCAAQDLPEVEAVVISHNHYDHMDSETLLTVYNLHKPHFFAPLGNMPHFAAIGIPSTHVHLLDWWEEWSISAILPSASTSTVRASDMPANDGVKASFILTCTPAQHTANRNTSDRWHTLWSSWAVEEDLSSSEPAASLSSSNGSSQPRVPRKVYFAGDTGYRTVQEGENEDEVPRCPAFMEIGERFGGFDLALLPIGAYAPRAMFSGLHSSPRDAVEIFKDIKARKAIGMHWGTWTLTTEPVMEPPALLQEACVEAGLAHDAFTVCALGETTVV